MAESVDFEITSLNLVSFNRQSESFDFWVLVTIPLDVAVSEVGLGNHCSAQVRVTEIIEYQ